MTTALALLAQNPDTRVPWYGAGAWVFALAVLILGVCYLIGKRKRKRK